MANLFREKWGFIFRRLAMQDWQHLIGKAQQGDLDSFDTLVQRFRDMAVAYAYAILGNFQLAEEAAQEAFVQAYGDLKSLREPLAFPSWLRRIVFKYCDRITRKKQLITVPIEMAYEAKEEGDSPEVIAQNHETHDAVLQTIKELPDHERTVTTLFYMNGYSLSEVGEFLEVPVGTVKNRLHAARKKLKERMVNMVEQTLKHHAPTGAFNEGVRKKLEQVPLVSFSLHQEKKKDGLSRCPESFAFPSCLRSCMEYSGEDLGYTRINVNDRDWRLDNTYVYLMGTTGCAFRLTWKPGWHLDNPALMYMAEDPLAPYKKGLAALGYEYEIITRETEQPDTAKLNNEAYFRRRIIESIAGQGRPLIGNGVVGPPVDCLITGFDEGGDVLIGWSYFQKMKDFSADVEFEKDGTFRKKNWYKDTHRLIILGEKKHTTPLERVYREALQWALHLIHTPQVQDRHSGLAAYRAWAEAIRQDEEFTGKKVKELVHRYHVHQDAVGAIAEGRWYAYQFLQKVIADINVPEFLAKAAQCYDEQHSLMWQVWGLVGGPGASPQKAKMFADSGIRKETAELILKAHDYELQAAAHIEETLNKW